MNIQDIKKRLEDSRSKKEILLEYLHTLDFFKSKISLKKFLKVLKEIDGFEIHYIYARLIVSEERESIKNNNLKDLSKTISTPAGMGEEKKMISPAQQPKDLEQREVINIDNGFKMQELISMPIDDLPEELKHISKVIIHDQTFDVRSSSYPDFKFFGSEDDDFNFVKNMESKGFKKGSDEYKFEQTQAKLKSKRRQEYREANKEFFRVAKKYIN